MNAILIFRDQLKFLLSALILVAGISCQVCQTFKGLNLFVPMKMLLLLPLLPLPPPLLLFQPEIRWLNYPSNAAALQSNQP